MKLNTVNEYLSFPKSVGGAKTYVRTLFKSGVKSPPCPPPPASYAYVNRRLSKLNGGAYIVVSKTMLEECGVRKILSHSMCIDIISMHHNIIADR